MSSTLDSIVAGSTVGAFLPPLTAIVQKPKWSARYKRVVAVVAAVLGGVATVASTGGLDAFGHGVPTLSTIVAVVAASQTTYDLVWKPSKVAPALEAATSSKARPTG
ncbi:hypothetical protein [Streptomyces pseudogriseolus]|uniref:hypothetical protein n=1 Tax=Streptomyces pseudogriseolus TaxID=36817 RepID=UPI000A3C13AE